MDTDAYTVEQFCRRHNLSRAQYYALRQRGEGPREMRIGIRGVRISEEAAKKWRREREYSPGEPHGGGAHETT